MEWILIGIVAGSLITGTFKDKESCLGRVATLAEQKINAKCVESPNGGVSIIGGYGVLGTWHCDDRSC